MVHNHSEKKLSPPDRCSVKLVAQFYDSPLAENCEITLYQTNAAEHAQISVDRALLARLLENLLSNSVRHVN